MRVRNFLLLSIIAITTPFLSANPDNGAEVLLPNESVSDTINQNSFKYYKIDLKKGETLTGLIDELSADADLYIKEGELPTRSSFDCRSTKGSVHIDSCNITVENSGFVYIGVYGYQTAEYRLLGTVIKEIDDHANTKEGATEIELNSVTHGRINGNDDRDFFKLVVPTHQYVTIFTEGGTDTFGRLYSEDGTKIIEHDDIDNPGGNKNFKIAKNLFAGTYYLEVKDYYAHKSGDYELNLLSMEIEADDHGDTKERATEVALNSRTKGRADGHEDVDFFKIVVPEIKRVTLSTEGSTDMFGTLYDANGVKIASHDDIDHARGNKNFKIEETLAKGTYYIKVHHYYKNRTGDYFFIVTSEEVEEDDHGDVKESATEVGLNSSTDGKIGSRGDIDFFKITLPNKKRVTIHTEGSTDMFGELFDANGTKLAQHDDIDHNGGNKNFKIVKELNAGVYYIKARHYYRNQVGNYLLKVSSEDLEADTVAPVITLNGESNLSLVQGSAYSEPGATALDDRDGNVSVAISGTVNTNVVGEYTVIYTAKDRANNSSTKTRTVHVVLPPDVTAPVITLNGDESITLIQGSEYVEQNATALDDRDGNVTVTISGRVNTNVVGEYTVIYTAKDRANNSSTKTRTVHVVLPPDVTVPVITLNGDESITLIQGSEYIEQNATALDDRDGNLSSRIVIDTSHLNVNIIGDYNITYNVTDRAGNHATQVVRVVHIVEAPDSAPVALINDENGTQTITLYEGGKANSVETSGEDDNGIVYCKWEDSNGTVIVEETINPSETILDSEHCSIKNLDLNLTSGQFQFTFTVRDIKGQTDSNELNITVLENHRPTVSINDGPIEIAVNRELRLRATADDIDADDDMNTLNYYWGYHHKGDDDFYDGGNSVEFVHTFDSVGVYEVFVTVVDSHGASSSTEVEIRVNSVNHIPVIKLIGNSHIYLEQDEEYVELNATASDIEDGNLTSKIVIDSSSLNIHQPGDYGVMYNVVDSQGAKAIKVKRVVTVKEREIHYSCPATSDSEKLFSDKFIESDHNDVAWSESKFNQLTVVQLERAFNRGRDSDDTVSGHLILPTQEKWDSMSESEKALYLINSERCARGLIVFEGVEPKVVTSPAQTYAEYLRDNQKFSHTADGRTPWERLTQDAGVTVNENADFFSYGENLAYQHTISSNNFIPVYHATVKSVYGWMYEDKGSKYGHRKFILATGLVENSGENNMEGVIGIGTASRDSRDANGGYHRYTYTVMNAFDPKSSWDNNLEHIIHVEIQEESHPMAL